MSTRRPSRTPHAPREAHGIFSVKFIHDHAERDVYEPVHLPLALKPRPALVPPQPRCNSAGASLADQQTPPHVSRELGSGKTACVLTPATQTGAGPLSTNSTWLAHEPAEPLQPQLLEYFGGTLHLAHNCVERASDSEAQRDFQSRSVLAEPVLLTRTPENHKQDIAHESLISPTRDSSRPLQRTHWLFRRSAVQGTGVQARRQLRHLPLRWLRR